MIKNHKLAKSISDVSWATFVQLLTYKMDWNGGTILKIPTFEPSTKICNFCGCRKELELSDRYWTCDGCGIDHDRDINAAINIKKYCLNNLNKIKTGHALSEELVELPTLVGAEKQENILV